ncbi:MAG: glycosyltransferase [Candidatus Omnitrophica bacterium]|nr:glycosyltransferase [Candidatus Omnitrophota bacterium]
MKNSHPHPQVAVSVINYNGVKHLDKCLASLEALNYPRSRLRLSLVDNGSTDTSLEFVQTRYPNVRILQNDQNNFSRALNLATRECPGEYVVFLNNDTTVERSWLKELVKAAQGRPEVAGVGSKILLSDGRINSAGHQELPSFYWEDRGFEEKDIGQYDEVTEVSSLSGCAAMYRKEYLEELGGFDEDFNIFLEDIEIGLRCRKKGWKLLYVPSSVVHHHFHGTVSGQFADTMVERNRLLLVAKHYPERLGEVLPGNTLLTDGSHLPYDVAYDHVVQCIQKFLASHDRETILRTSPSLAAGIRRSLIWQRKMLRKTFREHFSFRYSAGSNGKDSAEERDRIITQLVEAKERLARELQDSQNSIQFIRNELYSRDIQLAEERARANERAQRIDELRSEHNELSQRLKTSLQETEDRHRYAKSQEERLELELKKLWTNEQELAGLRVLLNEREAQLEEARAQTREMADFRHELTRRAAETEKLESTLNETNRRLQETSTEQEQLQQRLEAGIRQVSRLNLALADKVQEIKKIREAYDHKSAQLRDKDSEYSQLRIHCQNLSDANKKWADLAEQVNEEKEGLRIHLEEEVSNRQKQLDEVRRELGSAGANVAELKAQIEGLQVFYKTNTYRHLVIPVWKTANFFKQMARLFLRFEIFAAWARARQQVVVLKPKQVSPGQAEAALRRIEGLYPGIPIEVITQIYGEEIDWVEHSRRPNRRYRIYIHEKNPLNLFRLILLSLRWQCRPSFQKAIVLCHPAIPGACRKQKFLGACLSGSRSTEVYFPENDHSEPLVIRRVIGHLLWFGLAGLAVSLLLVPRTLIRKIRLRRHRSSNA